MEEAQQNSESTELMANKFVDAGFEAHAVDDEFVKVLSDDGVESYGNIEHLAETNGFFIYTQEASEYTLQSYESCPFESPA